MEGQKEPEIEFHGEKEEELRKKREHAMELLKKMVADVSRASFEGYRDVIEGSYFSEEEKDRLVKESGAADWDEFKKWINEKIDNEDKEIEDRDKT